MKWVLLALAILWGELWIPQVIQYIHTSVLTTNFYFTTIMWAIFGTGFLIMSKLDELKEDK